MMYVDKVLLTIILCATSAYCANHGTLVRNARTIGSTSFFAWPQTIRNLWDSRPRLWELAKRGTMNLVRFVSISSTPMRIEFRPEDGMRAAEVYRRRFGYRGEWLIEQLGNGLGPDVTLYRQSVPNTFLTPPLLPL